jgi:hypothetical protein
VRKSRRADDSWTNPEAAPGPLAGARIQPRRCTATFDIRWMKIQDADYIDLFERNVNTLKIYVALQHEMS